MFKVVRETEKYRHIRLLDTGRMTITFIEDKVDRIYDKIRIVKLGNMFRNPEIVTVYRYEDEQALEQIVNMYREQEVR